MSLSSSTPTSLVLIDADTSPPEVSNRSVTPSAFDNTAVLAVQSSTAKAATSKKSGRKGREEGAVAYSAAEHLALLSILSDVPDSFNSSESSDEWRKVYSLMVAEYYTVVGVQPRQSTTLQSHFVELYGGLKQGIRELSLNVGAPKCPLKFDINNVDLQLYITKLFEFIVSNPKNAVQLNGGAQK